MSHLPLGKIIAVIGAGTMGSGIAQVSATAGYQVKLYDVNAEAAKKGVETAQNFIRKMIDRERIETAKGEAAIKALSFVDSLEQLHDADLIIEAVVENLEVKQTIFKSLEAITSAECIYATNTSSISITAIAGAIEKPERVAGMHFFNPAPLMKLVEVVSGFATDKAVLDCLYDTAKIMGKTPVHTKSTPGFIVNRVARGFYSESLRLIEENASDPFTIDACLKEAGGFRMGPFELTDLIGQDVNRSVTETVWKAYHYDSRFTPSLVQEELVDARFLGRKSNRGFYDYREGAVNPEPQTFKSEKSNAQFTLYDGSDLTEAIKDRLDEKQIDYIEEDVISDERLFEVGDAVVFLTNGLTATQRAYELRIDNLILIDLAIDYKTVSRLAISAATQCSDTALNDVAYLFSRLGIAVSVMKDVPGLIVMRTVAMLANEAADAVNQNVSDIEQIDIAMTLGVNYPKGPLKWADEIGIDNLYEVISNLQYVYGEDRYRVSPLIQQKLYSGELFYDK